MFNRLSDLHKAILSVLGLVVLVLLGAYLLVGGRGKMTSATSPDGRYEAVLDERACYIDRNFDILLRNSQSGETRKIGWPLCPDQSPTIARESTLSGRPIRVTWRSSAIATT
ncbi:hypothetical protein Pla123a_34540 [Posidoniimonas polymericola]|uniref:Uncharacterized protein n=1 Tax=Posidoniimonas polymericola TaxID=2528002 RepID=A0A5C5YIE5_9BACT|nr:hypothetical protein [Posidoniimonas polymericola]TWT74630.1 hypothetical protein Pla123a_34540 [Posidoniimonas polymericola]